MTKNKKQPKGSKKPKNAQHTANTTSGKNNNENQPKTWQVVVRLVIVILLVLALGGSLFFGYAASAFSLPLPQTEQNLPAPQQQADYAGKTALGSSPLSYYNVQAGDRIDGRPAEDYAAATEDWPSVEAPMAALCTKDGRVLFERNIDAQVTMASTTKMMTAIVALENISLETPLKVTYGAANTLGTDAGLEEGMTISFINCLYALLLPSGNDAAVVIAENVSGMESRFVELMNAKAAELGMTSTLFADASGLSVENHYTTIRDYLILTRYCMENPTFREVVATSYYEVHIDGTVLELVTTDALGDYIATPEARAIGVKTGYTDEAGYCFVGAGELSGIELYSVVFNSPTGEQRFADSASLLDWGFRHFRTIELINTSQQVANVALLSWLDKTVPAFVASTVRVEIFDLNGPLTQDITINEIEGEASKGLICGDIIWSQGDEVLMTSSVVVTQTVLAPDFWESISIAWQRFWGGFNDEPAHAESSILLKNQLEIPAPLAEQLEAQAA